jgi:hypothetical protein
MNAPRTSAGPAPGNYLTPVSSCPAPRSSTRQHGQPDYLTSTTTSTPSASPRQPGASYTPHVQDQPARTLTAQVLMPATRSTPSRVQQHHGPRQPRLQGRPRRLAPKDSDKENLKFRQCLNRRQGRVPQEGQRQVRQPPSRCSPVAAYEFNRYLNPPGSCGWTQPTARSTACCSPSTARHRRRLARQRAGGSLPGQVQLPPRELLDHRTIRTPTTTNTPGRRRWSVEDPRGAAQGDRDALMGHVGEPQ